jgi:glycosyltransferase involved in cell wall biosynthesis
LAVPLRLVGDGPLRGLAERAAGSNIVVVGWRTPEAVAEEMARAAFLVLPSIWPENFPMVIVEAFSRGLPVIASRIPALEEIIEDGTSGVLFRAGDPADLASKVNWAYQHPEAMRNMAVRARRVYEQRYSPSANFAQLAKIYKDAMAEARSVAVGRPAGEFVAEHNLAPDGS